MESGRNFLFYVTFKFSVFSCQKHKIPIFKEILIDPKICWNTSVLRTNPTRQIEFN